jgi:hypothetical protein
VRLPFVSPVRGNVGIPRQGRAMGYLFSRRARFSTAGTQGARMRCLDGPFAPRIRGSTQKPRQGEVPS